jgi:hypothetical protein
MSTNNFIPSREWNAKSIGYAKCKANPGGLGRSGLVNNKKGKPIEIITPIDMLCWGAEQGKDSSGNSLDKYSVSIQFPNEEYPNEEQSAFLLKIKEFESQLLADAISNYKEWFPNLVSDDADADTVAAITVKRGFKSALKYPKIAGTERPNYERPPTLRVNLPLWEGSAKFRLFDSSTRETIFPNGDADASDVLRKMDKITAFIRCGGRWFVNDTWGYKWNLVMATVTKSEFMAAPENPWDIIDFGLPNAPEPAKPAPVDEDDGIAISEATAEPVRPPSPPEDMVDGSEEDPEPEPVKTEPAKKPVMRKKTIVKKV